MMKKVKIEISDVWYCGDLTLSVTEEQATFLKEVADLWNDKNTGFHQPEIEFSEVDN